MKKFGIFLCEQFVKENEDDISPEFEEILKQAQAAYDQGQYDKAYEIINGAEAQSSGEERLKQHFITMLSDKMPDFNADQMAP